MKNLLIETLPSTVTVGGRVYDISTDFSTGIAFELLMQDDTKSFQERMVEALELYYPVIPTDIEEAVDKLLWFYRCGVEERKGGGGGKRSKKAYCFDQDAGLVFASFLTCYQIDLTRVEHLHWWTFRALFMGLPAECELKKVMGYRTAELKDMSKAQKKLYEKMRKVYALKVTASADSAISLAQRNADMMAYVNRRFEEAGGSH